MNKDKLKGLLTGVREGTVEIDEAMRELKSLPFEDMGFARVDHHRELRTGHPEVIFCQGKTSEQIAAIVERLRDKHHAILATRATQENFDAVKKVRKDAVYHERARVIKIGEAPEPATENEILVITAGTADIPVAEEAVITAETMGNRVKRLTDVGVAGIHRLFGSMEELMKANVIIVVAGMDGALPSIIGGLVSKPVIAVPTSVGYGSSFDGLAALLTMLNSCAPGVSVVNIDNGFGAGYSAAIINNQNIGE